MKKTMIRSAHWLALLAGLALSAGAQAASTWAFSGSGGNDPVTGEPLAKLSYANNGVAALTIDGVYGKNGSGDSGFASGAKWNNTSTPDSNLLYFNGNGLGMCSGYDVSVSCQAPNHAMDNNGNTEGVLLSFTSSVVLTSIGIGYKSGDADISLWRYTGTSAPAAINTIGADKTSMQNAGWSLVGNYADLTEDTSNPYNAVNSGNLGSSWWLVTAYNTSYGTTSANGGALGQGNDYFKIYAVAGNACTGGTDNCGGNRAAPEPGSLALASLAIGGVIFSRRRKTAKD